MGLIYMLGMLTVVGLAYAFLEQPVREWVERLNPRIRAACTVCFAVAIIAAALAPSTPWRVGLAILGWILLIPSMGPK